MDGYVTKRKRDRNPDKAVVHDDDQEESTEVKLAMLSSLHPNTGNAALLDVLIANNGCVETASASFTSPKSLLPSGQIVARTAGGTGPAIQTSLLSMIKNENKRARPLSQKGTTLHLFDPVDVAADTPCTVLHNFLPPDLATSLLHELLEESKTFGRTTFKLFDNVVQSPHTSSFYVATDDEATTQREQYVYNGARLADVRRLTPGLEAVRSLVQQAVNAEIQHRIRTAYPGSRKLRFQSPLPWSPNAAFVNCYEGPRQNVGWHSDQLTYLGPRPVIGSLSLGAVREFRVRRVVETADSNTGQIAVHLPHNSLLVMHAEMQEEWKHRIAPAATLSPHPLSGLKRINVTYRDYRPDFHPRFTPRCSGCDVPAVLRVVQQGGSKNLGRYFWMCHAGNVPGKTGCSYFHWAEFDDDGHPMQPPHMDRNK